MINVSELIEDPDFCQPSGIKVKRTTVSIINHTPVEKIKVITLQGIITINSENTDELLSEADRNSESINIFTYNRLKTVGKDKLDGKSYGADIIIFEGNEYIVKSCMNDAQYGFCKSIAVKMRQDSI